MDLLKEFREVSKNIEEIQLKYESIRIERINTEADLINTQTYMKILGAHEEAMKEYTQPYESKLERLFYMLEILEKELQIEKKRIELIILRYEKEQMILPFERNFEVLSTYNFMEYDDAMPFSLAFTSDFTRNNSFLSNHYRRF